VDERAQRTHSTQPATVRRSKLVEPDHGYLYASSNAPNVTLQLLWEEYQGSAWLQRLQVQWPFATGFGNGTRRSSSPCGQIHPAGERAFSWTLLVIPCPSSILKLARSRKPQIFVAVLGASSYTFACATQAQRLKTGSCAPSAH